MISILIGKRSKVSGYGTLSELCVYYKTLSDGKVGE